MDAMPGNGEQPVRSSLSTVAEAKSARSARKPLIGRIFSSRRNVPGVRQPVTEAKRQKTRASVFRRYPKIDDAALIRLAYLFCSGVSVDIAAKTLGLSRKTARQFYLDFRARLKKPAFRRWHSLSRALLSIDDPERDTLIRTTFIDVLTECHDNRTCLSVYRRGNRKNRLCRTCPLPGKFTQAALVDEALGLIDGIHTLYAALGIRETETDRLKLFRERVIHTSVVATAGQNTRQLKTGAPDPSDQSYLAVGQLMMCLMDDLAADQSDTDNAGPDG